MSETDVINGLETIFQEIEYFGEGDITIDDFSILDGPVSRAPYLIIETADEFVSIQGTVSESTSWEISVMLYVRFTNWKESKKELRTVRQALIDKANALAGERSARLTTPVTINTIRQGSPILEYYSPYLSTEELRDALPLYLVQQLIFVAEEY